MSERYKLFVDRVDSRGNDPTLVEGSLSVVCAALHELTKYTYSLEGLRKLTVESLGPR